MRLSDGYRTPGAYAARMRTKKALSIAILIGTYSCALTSSVLAIPAQTLPAFRRWCAWHVVLRGIAQSTDELSRRPSFDLLAADHGIVWHFDARTNGYSIESETLAIGEGNGQPGSFPIRHNGIGYGFAFFRNLYGSSVASDFTSSRLTQSIADSQSRIVTQFYRGARFGYEVANGAVTVATHAVVERDRALLAKCKTHPTDCSE
jgi:hypothetical protein